LSEIQLSDRRQDIGLFHIRPRTGKKHQIRVHMANIGYPILGDPLYPEMNQAPDQLPALQLLAARLSFIDPVTGVPHIFASSRLLNFGHVGTRTS
jgi:tRNA pseudouridine32 synthase/23S rRNA pseudouridine746 synthase